MFSFYLLYPSSQILISVLSHSSPSLFSLPFFLHFSLYFLSPLSFYFLAFCSYLLTLLVHLYFLYLLFIPTFSLYFLLHFLSLHSLSFLLIHFLFILEARKPWNGRTIPFGEYSLPNEGMESRYNSFIISYNSILHSIIVSL